MQQESKEVRKDSEWGIIDGELCRVIDFTPFAWVRNNKVMTPNSTDPYASIILECKKVPNVIKGFITHKIDFIHLWVAFKERGINEEKEEVLINWSAKSYKYKIYQIISNFLLNVLGGTPFPKLIVMICPKGAFKLITDLGIRPELQGEARFLAEKPIIEWRPEVMK